MIQYNLDLITDLSSEIANYWLGWFITRAYIDPKRNRIRCSVPFKDIGHLYLLLKDLHANTVPRRIVKIIKGQKYKGAYININSKKLKEFLLAQGWPKRGTGIELKFFNKIDKRHFLRGMLDGHGIFTTNRGNLRIGYKSKFYSLVYHLMIDIIISNGFNKPPRVINGWWSGEIAVNICRFLYCNSTRHLKRHVVKVMPYLTPRPVNLLPEDIK